MLASRVASVTMAAARRAPVAQARSLATSAGGVKRESSFVRVWLKPKEAWPIFAMMGFALGFVGWKLGHDANHPEYHFTKASRGTLAYVDPKSPAQAKDAESWANSTFHSGPGFIQGRKIAAAEGQ